MAGSAFAISSTNKKREKNARDLQISPVINEWQVGYARFVNSHSSAFTSTHPSLTPVPKHRHRGAWISTAEPASVKLIYEKTSSGTDDAVLVLSIRSKILEVHYISKMHFSWPQIKCISDLPARGSKAVFLSYKDCVGQVQKFALRFSSIYETDKFMNVVKGILGHEDPPLLLCPELNSGISSQAEAISSQITISTTSEELQLSQSVDNSTQLMIPSCALVVTHDSETHEAAKVEPNFPPSFMQLMNSCHPPGYEGRQPSSIMSFDASLVDYLNVETKGRSGDLKTQFVQYLEETPFKELLATVENVISQMGDDMVQ